MCYRRQKSRHKNGIKSIKEPTLNNKRREKERLRNRGTEKVPTTIKSTSSLTLIDSYI